jgi:drug/metabolite transporter (DMT)-like permease
MTPRTDNLPLGIGALIFTVFALSLGDAFIKQISTGFGLWQLFAIRSAFALPILMIAVGIFVKVKRPRSIFWVTIRSGLLVISWIFYYASLPHLSLAVASSVLYTLPMFITLFSALWLRERLTRSSIGAVVLGFTGVLIILRPDTSGLTVVSGLPLLAAITYAFTMVLTRAKCRDENALVMGTWLNGAFIVFGLVGLIVIPTAPTGGFLNAEWVSMGVSEWQATALLAVSILIGSVGTALAYQNGPSSILGVFDFGYVGFAVIWGYLLFSEVPDAATFAGIALIVGSGVISARR